MPKKVQAYTVRGAADELGVSTTMIYHWLATGLLKETLPLNAERGKGHARLVDAQSVLELKARRELAETEAE